MKILIEPVEVHVSASLEEHIKERLNNFFSSQDYITGIDVYVKKAEEKVKNECIIEAKVYLPGPELFAESAAVNYHAALNETIGKLQRQLEKYKEKHRSYQP